jgi:hypothetical protein
MKTCKRCGAGKPLDEFFRDRRCKDGRMGNCKVCVTARMDRNIARDPDRYAGYKQKWADANRDQVRVAIAAWREKNPDYWIRRNFGLTAADRDAILEAQGGVCAICGSGDPDGREWSIDHSHSCCPGQNTCGNCVRGVVHGSCNLQLGRYEAGQPMAAAEMYENYLRSCNRDMGVKK